MTTTSSLINGVYRMGYIDDLKSSKNSVPYINFSVAFNDNFRHNDDGVFVYDTHWLNCVAYYKTAQKIAQNIRTGALVFASGSLSFKKTTNKQGVEVEKPLVTVTSIQKLLDSKKDKDEGVLVDIDINGCYGDESNF